MKSTFRKAKANEKSEKTSSLAAGVGLRLRLLKLACATEVGLRATISVDLCHGGGLEYLSHGFQTQGTVAAGASLSGATRVDLYIWAMDFRPKVQLPL
jgi:hypothetical protein